MNLPPVDPEAAARHGRAKLAERAATNGHHHEDPEDPGPSWPGEGEEVARYLALRPASEVRVDRPSWTWDRRIPIGGVTLVAGREGLGKTALMGFVAARLTRGQLEGDRRGRPADVVYIGMEDDYSTVLVPRLMAAGADLDRVLFVELPAGASFSVAVDTLALGDRLASLTVSGRRRPLLGTRRAHRRGCGRCRRA